MISRDWDERRGTNIVLPPLLTMGILLGGRGECGFVENDEVGCRDGG